MPTDLRRAFTEGLMDRLATMNDDQADWYEALLYTAMDRAGGDIMKALDLADEAYESEPEPPEDDEEGEEVA